MRFMKSFSATAQFPLVLGTLAYLSHWRIRRGIRSSASPRPSFLDVCCICFLTSERSAATLFSRSLMLKVSPPNYRYRENEGASLEKEKTSLKRSQIPEAFPTRCSKLPETSVAPPCSSPHPCSWSAGLDAGYKGGGGDGRISGTLSVVHLDLDLGKKGRKLKRLGNLTPIAILLRSLPSHLLFPRLRSLSETERSAGVQACHSTRRIP